MFAMGTTDVFVNWVNFLELNLLDHSRGLVLGPIPQFLWITLLVFTIVGSVFYVLESINTFSIFFSTDGQTKVPIVWEQMLILTLEHIPLAGINFFISQCRSQYYTMWQTTSGSIYILYIFTRLLWHAHMEGRLLRDVKDYKMRKGTFMAVCALYSCAMAFPVICWRFGPPEGGLKAVVEDVNIYLLKAPFLETRTRGYDLTPVLLSQGRDLHQPYIVKSIKELVIDYDHEIYTAKYTCNRGPNVTFIVPQCPDDGHIVFSFQYPRKSDIEPFGEIQFNYAFVPLGATAADLTQCVPSTGDFEDNWHLYYLTTAFMHMHDAPLRVFISSAWQRTCLAPRPWYNPDIPVCGL